VLSLGVANEGFSDPRVVNLGNALSRAGVVVMIYWSPEMALRHQIDPDEPDKLVSAYLYLAEQDYVDPERVAIGGFSAGAAFALMAAADRRIRDQIYQVNVFGPYFDAETLLLQATSRSTVYEGEQRPWEPDRLVMQVLATELIEVLNNPEEAALLTRRYVDGHTISSEKLGGLSSQGKVIVRLLDGVSLEEAQTLFGLLPSSKRRELAQISPATYISDVRARVLVLHDYNDNMVPSSESRRLMEALKSRGNIRYTEVRSFDHATVDRSSVLAYLGDAARLYWHMYEVLRVAS
jgi:predicted esterase